MSSDRWLAHAPPSSDARLAFGRYGRLAFGIVGALLLPLAATSLLPQRIAAKPVPPPMFTATQTSVEVDDDTPALLEMAQRPAPEPLPLQARPREDATLANPMVTHRTVEERRALTNEDERLVESLVPPVREAALREDGPSQPGLQPEALAAATRRAAASDDPRLRNEDDGRSRPVGVRPAPAAEQRPPLENESVEDRRGEEDSHLLKED